MKLQLFRDSFNNWNPLRSNAEGGHVFAETLPAPKNFYLVNLLNCFGAQGGFDLLLWHGMRQHLPFKVSWTGPNFPSIQHDKPASGRILVHRELVYSISFNNWPPANQLNVNANRIFSALMAT